MTFPARVRLHYGHPDLFNKLYVMTKGGISKATRSLHLTEDVFCGCNHMLRGARIRCARTSFPPSSCTSATLHCHDWEQGMPSRNAHSCVCTALLQSMQCTPAALTSTHTDP